MVQTSLEGRNLLIFFLTMGMSTLAIADPPLTEPAVSVPSPSVRWHSLLTIPIPELIQKALNTSDLSERILATKALHHLRDKVTDQDVMPLIEAIQNKQSHSETRYAAVFAIKELRKAAKKAIPILIDVLGDTKSESYIRVTATQALGFMEEHAKSALSMLMLILEEDKNHSVREAAKNTLIQLEKSREMAEEISRLKISKITQQTELPKDLCKVLCTLVRNHSQWSRNNFERSEFFKEPQSSRRLALLSLKILFLVKAAPFCPEIETLPKQFLHQLWTTSDSFAACQDPSRLNLFPEFKTWLELFNKVLLHVDPWSTTELWGKQFLFFLQNQLSAKYHVTDLAFMGLRFSDVKVDLENDLLEATGSKLKGTSGSAFNTFAFASSIISLQSSLQKSKSLQKAIKHLREIVEQARSYYTEPMALPYYPTSDSFKLSENNKSSAARAVPVYFALYLTEKEPLRHTKNKKDLITALENWVIYMPDLKSQIPENHFHFEDNDGLAPFYFYPSAPYVSAAIRLLLEKETLDPSEKEKLLNLKEKVIKSLSELFQKDGLFVPQGRLKNAPHPHSPGTYPSSPAYVNPLAGLAIMPLLDECGGKKIKSFGILPSEPERKKPY